jgi:hypothetical protein
MALEFAPLLSAAILDAFESHIGTSPLLKVFTGSPPATVGDADSGTLLASMTLPSDWMAAASGNSKAKSGTWSDSLADAAGTPGYVRIYTSGSVAKFQCTAGVGSGDLSFDATIALGGVVTITTFTLTGGNPDA